MNYMVSIDAVMAVLDEWGLVSPSYQLMREDIKNIRRNSVMEPANYEPLLVALRDQGRVEGDQDGSYCIVSRQAVDDAIKIIFSSML